MRPAEQTFRPFGPCARTVVDDRPALWSAYRESVISKPVAPDRSSFKRNSCFLRSRRWFWHGLRFLTDRPQRVVSLLRVPGPESLTPTLTLRVPSLVFLCEPPKPESRTPAYRFKSSLKNYTVSKDGCQEEYLLGRHRPRMSGTPINPGALGMSASIAAPALVVNLGWPRRGSRVGTITRYHGMARSP